MALVQCPGCKMYVSSKGGKCASCGHALGESAVVDQGPQYKPLTPSVGACPACGSRDTFDHVAETQRTTTTGGLEQLAAGWGAKFKLAVTGAGRCCCAKCGHHWHPT